MRRLKLFFKYAILLGAGILLLIVFIPRNYDVPQIKKKEGTQYWELPSGSKIAYTLQSADGKRNSIPIIYLQGGPGGFISERIITLFAPLAEDGYDIYFYDQIGSGESDRLSNINNYTAERHKEDLEAIIETIGAEKVILIGQSWGAILATMFIADHPEKVQKAIFTGPGPILPRRQDLLNTQIPDSLNLKQAPYTNHQANEKSTNLRIELVTLLAKSFGFKLASDQEADDYQTFLNHELNKATVCDTSKALEAEGGGGFYAQIMTVSSFRDMKDQRSKLKRSGIPVLIMKGECDHQAWGYLNEYLELFPDNQLKIISDAGHSIYVEQPELYLKTIRDFLNQDTNNHNLSEQ